MRQPSRPGSIALNRFGTLKTGRAGLVVARDDALVEVHQPAFGDAVPRVQRQLDAAVVGEAAVGGGGMGTAVVVGAWAQQGDVGLRFGEIAEADWILRAVDRALVDRLPEKLREQFDHAAVPAANWRHIDDFPFNQLHPTRACGDRMPASAIR